MHVSPHMHSSLVVGIYLLLIFNAGVSRWIGTWEFYNVEEKLEDEAQGECRSVCSCL